MPSRAKRRTGTNPSSVAPFRFLTETGVVRWTGHMAADLSSLLAGLQHVPGSSIYYHVHHAVFRRPKYSWAGGHTNDFARWVSVTLGQKGLAEKLSSVDPLEVSTVREVRDRLVGHVQEYVAEAAVFPRVPRGQELHFLDARSFVLDTQVEARDVAQLVDGIKKLGAGCVMYHFIEARFRNGVGTNDFSRWLGLLGQKEKAAALERVNPYYYDMAELRAQLVEALEA